MKRLIGSVLLLVGVSSGLADPVPSPPVVHRASGAGGAVASPHPLATQAGLATLREGGNAIDAVVAIGLMLGVVDGHNSGIGGGCFLLIHTNEGALHALDGREMAPAAAHRTMYLREDGSPDTQASKTGPLAPGIPGSLAVYDHAIRHFGKLSLAAPLRRAAEVAERGFQIDARYAGRLQAEAGALETYSGTKSPFFREDGTTLRDGEVLRQPDLAAAYRSLATDGISWFYSGPFAQATARWMTANGGLATAADFANYEMKERVPLRTTYRGCEIIGFPPPSSGGTHVAQILNILECFDLSSCSEADRIHLVIEAMKLAFADRAHWLGDADHVDVPLAGLVSKDYARRLASTIDRTKARTVPSHGNPTGAPSTETPSDRHTAHFTAVDRHGNWVACTATLNTSFGSKVLVPGTGVLLNNQMDDFSIKPGTPNAFGLVGAEANAIAPGKRPLSSMSPTIVLRDGKPVLTVGAAGGPTIITQSLLAIMRTIDLGTPLDEAVAAPRFHHQWKPDHVMVEPDLPAAVRENLRTRGHQLRERAPFGTTQAIAIDQATGRFTAVSEPRALGQAACLEANP